MKIISPLFTLLHAERTHDEGKWRVFAIFRCECAENVQRNVLQTDLSDIQAYINYTMHPFEETLA
jgi:hypothetical protein